MANWFRANKMSLNVSKTKYIIFRTQNKPVDPAVCNLVYNTNEFGLPEDPALITPIEPTHPPPHPHAPYSLFTTYILKLLAET
jgi:hypothetical protein